MNPAVAKSFEYLQNDLIQLLSRLDGIAPEQLESSPRKDKWSVTQVMYHLNAAESLSVLYVSKKRLGAAQLKRTGWEAQLRLIIAKVSFYLPLKYKTPKVLGEVPAYVNYHEIKQAWLKTRREMAALLDSLSDDELHKPIFKQPAYGRWNIFQMLGFMQTHFKRHRKQIMHAIELTNP